MPEVASFLGGKEELLLPLHRVGPLVGHVERIRGEITVFALERRGKLFVVVAQFLYDPCPLFEQALFQVGELLLVHLPPHR